VIRGVAVTFGVLAILLMVVGAVVVFMKAADWLHRRREVRRLAESARRNP
jgi:hypothetical protein